MAALIHRRSAHWSPPKERSNATTKSVNMSSMPMVERYAAKPMDQSRTTIHMCSMFIRNMYHNRLTFQRTAYMTSTKFWKRSEREHLEWCIGAVNVPPVTFSLPNSYPSRMPWRRIWSNVKSISWTNYTIRNCWTYTMPSKTMTKWCSFSNCMYYCDRIDLIWIQWK